MDNIEHIKRVTPYQDINDVLYFLAQGIKNIFGDNLCGFYLTGSLSYGDFDLGRSDIDLAVIIKKSATTKEIESANQLHSDAELTHKKWSKRIECSYVTLDMLQNILPPKDPRPYVGGGIFYPSAPYGNEWIINNFFLYKSGVALIGPNFKTLVKAIDIKDVRAACVNDLHKEWEPKIADTAFLDDSHQQSYVVLNLCRIIYAVKRGDAVSKKIAATWTAKEYPQWENLIKAADSWHYGLTLGQQKEVINFIKFIIAEVESQNNINQKMNLTAKNN